MKESTRPRYRKLSALSVAALLAGALFTSGGAAQAADDTSGAVRQLSFVGTTSLADLAAGAEAGQGLEVRRSPRVEDVGRSGEQGTPSSPSGPAQPSGSPVTASTAAKGFNGLSHRDQRLAGTGRYTNTQFSLEPPDQGLCVGNGFILETVNTALAVYSPEGNLRKAPTAINQFLNLNPEVIRSTPPVFGEFTSDPRCLFDADTGQFFFTAVEIDVDSRTGDFAGGSKLFIAVTRTGDPTREWNIFKIDVTNDGTAPPGRPRCPCFGDQPLIGTDAFGFYLSTNSFNIALGFFRGAQLYATSKRALARGTAGTVVHLTPQANPGVRELPASIQPAMGQGARAHRAKGGTEFFLSVADLRMRLDNRVAVWRLANTASLDSASPAVSLSHIIVQTEVFGEPPDVPQKNGSVGSRPLGEALGEGLELISTGDQRMQQVVFADGKLFGALTTIVLSPLGVPQAGIAFFVFEPQAEKEGIVELERQGYVRVDNNHVIYPAIGVNAEGDAVLVFTLVGPDHFPSAAIKKLDDDSKVEIVAVGAGPEDGFSGYRAFGAEGTARWGDYSAAAADSDGSIWLATEFIPRTPRTLLANWGTFIARLQP